MKGLDALAKACEPAPEPTNENAAAGLQLTDEQIDKIAARMIEKLQNQQPETHDEKDEPEPDPEPGEPGEEETEDAIS